MDVVKDFTLENKGAFIVALQIEWSTNTAHGVYEHSDSFRLHEKRNVDLSNVAEIPQGASVRLKAAVSWGKSIRAAEQFTYSSKYGGSVAYAVEGTTLSPSLQLEKQDAKHIVFGTQSLYQCLYDGILSAYPALRQGKNSCFQFAAAPMSAAWGQNDYGVFYGLADAAPGGKGSFYLTGSSHISQSYSDLLSSIAIGTGEDDPAYQRLEDQYKTALALYNQTVNEADNAFLLAKQQGSTAAKDLTEWLETMEGRAYQRRLKQLEAQAADYESAMEEIAKRVREPLEKAQAALQSDRMSYVDGAQSVVSVPRTVIGGNLLEDTMRWKKLVSNYRQGLKIGFDLNLDIVPRIGTDGGIEGYPAGGMESKIDFEKLILDKCYSLRLKAVGFNSYPVIRGTWYDDTFVRKEVKLYETSRFNISHFFGKDGVLCLIPVMVAVAYHPILELTVSKAAYAAEIQQQLAGCQEGFRFCGFALGGAKALEIYKNEDDEDVVTLTLEAADTQPAQLIGVVSMDKTA